MLNLVEKAADKKKTCQDMRGNFGLHVHCCSAADTRERRPESRGLLNDLATRSSIRIDSVFQQPANFITQLPSFLLLWFWWLPFNVAG